MTRTPPSLNLPRFSLALPSSPCSPSPASSCLSSRISSAQPCPGWCWSASGLQLSQQVTSITESLTSRSNKIVMYLSHFSLCPDGLHLLVLAAGAAQVSIIRSSLSCKLITDQDDNLGGGERVPAHVLRPHRRPLHGLGPGRGQWRVLLGSLSRLRPRLCPRQTTHTGRDRGFDSTQFNDMFFSFRPTFLATAGGLPMLLRELLA